MFVSDQFMVTNKLTLNVSLRWDLNGRLHEKNGNQSNWDFNAQNPNWVASAGNPGLLGNISYLAGPWGQLRDAGRLPPLQPARGRRISAFS